MEQESKLYLVPLGGLGEIGKNMMAVQYEDNIIVIDAGLMFPDEAMLGIDLVIPDITYLVENRSKVKAILLTHGHEDHIGALPFVLKEVPVPVYATRLTLGLVEVKLKENNYNYHDVEFHEVKPRDMVNIGPFWIEFFRVAHSIPDAVGIAIHTPVGVVVHTGDFKIDLTPVDDERVDFYKLAELGEQGVLLLLSDSTNVERAGYTASEKTVGLAFDEVFSQSRERIIIATFASNVHRLQQAIECAVKYNRKVAVVGRSMVNVIDIAFELGYINIPEGLLVDVDEIKNLPANQVVLLTTGSQGEPMSALTRIALGEHRQVDIQAGDTVILSANPIPGNEKLVARIVNLLFKRGANVIYELISGTHVSGHPSQEELKLMFSLLKPKFFVPVHGEHRHLKKHAQLACEMGVDAENIIIAENGHVLEFSSSKGKIVGRVPAGRVLVDGLGVGDVGSVVLRDRKQLAEEGILIVVLTIDPEDLTIAAGPDIISRGFVYVRESTELMERIRKKAEEIVDNCLDYEMADWTAIKTNLRDGLGKYLFEKTRRRPMVLPIIMEI